MVIKVRRCDGECEEDQLVSFDADSAENTASFCKTKVVLFLSRPRLSSGDIIRLLRNSSCYYLDALGFA